MRLLLIRHGQTPANVAGIVSTAKPGPRLTALGREQAAVLPDALAGEGIEALFVSSLVRTHETAVPLALSLGLTPIELDDLREIEAGDLEGGSDEASYQAYLDPIYHWIAGDTSAQMPGGPSGDEFFARFDAAIGEVAASGTRVAAAVSHGAAIRIWAATRGANLSVDGVHHHNLDNTGIVTLEGDPEAGWQVVDWAGSAIGDGVSSGSSGSSADPTGRG